MPLAYSHSFRTSSGLLVYVPTEYGQVRGYDIIKLVLNRWRPPPHFFHFRSGGHVAACLHHKASSSFAHSDIESFFDSVTRTKVHRVLRRLGVPHEDALEITHVSTVARVAEPGKYALPFGFVQSMVLASAALDRSQLGKHLRIGHRYHVKVSVYVDDILLSAAREEHLEAYMADLIKAGHAAGYCFNASKMSPPGSKAEAFNIIVSADDLHISAARMAAFEGAVHGGSPATASAVLRYVESVNKGQAECLGRLEPASARWHAEGAVNGTVQG
jgi:hypothetical protein